MKGIREAPPESKPGPPEKYHWVIKRVADAIATIPEGVEIDLSFYTARGMESVENLAHEEEEFYATRERRANKRRKKASVAAASEAIVVTP
jgi:polyphosphate kinase 2 (PPK2 family)